MDNFTGFKKENSLSYIAKDMPNILNNNDISNNKYPSILNNDYSNFDNDLVFNLTY